MILLSIYAGALVFGGVFVAASALGFDKDHEAEAHADAHLDSADDAHVDSEGGAHEGGVGEVGAFAATVFSLRFWTFAATTFGLTGALLEVFGVSPMLSVPASLAAGLGVGLAVATVFRLANKRSVGTIADVKTLLGREGTVLLAITPDKPGKIRVTHDGQSLDLLARTRDERPFGRGDKVLVVDMKGGEATVTSPAPSPPHPT